MSTIIVRNKNTNTITVRVKATGPTGPAGNAGAGVATGGSAGQSLVKVSSTDYDTTWSTPPGGGDMVAATYDPTSVSADTFYMDNMSEGVNSKILSVAERTKLTNTSGINTGDQDIANDPAVLANTAKISYPSTDSVKVGYIAVTQNVDLDVLESDVATNNIKVGVTSEISNVVEDITPQLGGELELNNKAIVGTFTAGEAIVPGDLCYLTSTGDVLKADATTETMVNGFLVLATETLALSASGLFTILGSNMNYSGLVIGAVCYVSTIAGSVTQTRPTVTGNFVRVVGYAKSTTEVFFTPSPVWVEI